MALWLTLISVVAIGALCVKVPFVALIVAIIVLLELLGVSPISRWIDRLEDWSYGYQRGDSDRIDI